MATTSRLRSGRADRDRAEEPGERRTFPSELVIFIAAEKGLADRLLAAHVADDHGWCRACPNGGAANTRWPCPIHDAAADVKKRSLATIERQALFAERGYTSSSGAVGDLLRCDWSEARRRTLAAGNVHPTVGLDGTERPPRLPATAAVFAAGAASLRHVEVVADLLDSPAAQRLEPDVWAAAEAQIAAQIADYTPSQLRTLGRRLIEALDQDGPEPTDDPERLTNELHLIRYRRKSGGKILGTIEDEAIFDVISRAIAAGAKPCDDDHRSAARRRADALADVCAQALDSGMLPESGGQRPVVTVHIPLADLQDRCRSAVLDTGYGLHPEALRMIACDSGIVPVVLDGAGQPLDVGRLKRTIPDGLRRAVAARDLGCAHPGCDRPPSWAEVHHIRPWQEGGETKLDNLVMLCRPHHRLMHYSGWIVRIRDGLPEFIPPRWTDPDQTPRRKPLPQLINTG